jgi:hypothetical protein
VDVMAHTPNPDDFSFHIDENKYRVTLRIEGEMSVKIEANSKDEAKRKAEDMADKLADDCLEIELDDFDDVSVGYHIQVPRKMYRITRDGQKLQTTTLRPGDLPRDPRKSAG